MEVKITRDNFHREVLQSDVPVLLDLWAYWCGPCRMQAPALAELGAEREGALKIGKVNVDEQPELAAAFHVTSIPMLVLFKNGQLVNGAIGYHTKDQLSALLDDWLKG